MFKKLKIWRRLATRYDKSAQLFLGFISVAAAKVWLPFVDDA